MAGKIAVRPHSCRETSAEPSQRFGKRLSEDMNKPPDKPVLAEERAVDVELFARNLARLVEEGGKALSAYLKPREQGAVKDDFADHVTDAVKTLGQVAEYWLSDPARAVELQASLGRAYLDLWGTTV